MLRAIGAQIEKTTNHEALRDLSGRRMRDVNNEKALKEWLAKQTDKEREREEKRQERLARRRAMPNHKFDDPTYDQQRSQLAESQEQALLEGLKKSQAGPSTSTSDSKKRKTEEPLPGASKQRKTTEWLGIDVDNLSDLDSEDDENSPSTSNSVNSDSNDLGNINSNDHERNSQSETIGTYTHDSVTDNSESVIESQGVHETESSEQEKLKKLEEKVHEDAGNQPEVTQTETVIEDKSSGETLTENVKDKVTESKDEPKTGPINLDSISSAAELLEYGLDIMKQELMNRGLKCGGTLEQRAERLFSVKGLTQEEIEPSLFAKNGGKNLKKKS